MLKAPHLCGAFFFLAPMAAVMGYRVDEMHYFEPNT
jgi:hypothetical protein